MSSDNEGIRINMKVLATIIGLLIMLGGLVASYASSQALVNTLQNKQSLLIQEFKEYREKTDQRIMEMKLDITSMSTDLRTIKADVQEIKSDIKKILRGTQ